MDLKRLRILLWLWQFHQRIPADALLLGTDSRQDGHSFYRRTGLFVDVSWYAAEILRRHD